MREIHEEFFDGMDVYDADGSGIGKVTRYDAAVGYFQLDGVLSGPRYVPFLSIERVGPTGAQLNVTKDVVSNAYRRMPRVTLAVEDGKIAATVQSGRSGGAVPLDAEAIRALREQIHVGTSVFDYDELKIGNVEAYDPKIGYMRIEKGHTVAKDIFLPVTSVSYLDDRGIHLWMTKTEIANRFSHFPEVARDAFPQ